MGRGKSTPQGCSLYMTKPDVILDINLSVVLCSLQIHIHVPRHVLQILFRDVALISSTVILEDTDVGDRCVEDAGKGVSKSRCC